MADGSGVSEDLVVVAARIRLVSDEVDLLKTFILNVLECIGLVPAPREDVERDLAADGIREVVFREFFLEDLDEFAANLVLLVVPLEFMALSN